MRINPGDLTALVQFRRAEQADDGFASTAVFVDHGSPVRARKRDISDGERWVAGEFLAEGTSRFVLRRSAFTAALTAKDQLVCAGSTFSISHIKELNDGKRWLEITASTRPDK